MLVQHFPSLTTVVLACSSLDRLPYMLLSTYRFAVCLSVRAASRKSHRPYHYRDYITLLLAGDEHASLRDIVANSKLKTLTVFLSFLHISMAGMCDAG